MEDDEYWNTSETKAKAFSFDDDVLFSQEILSFGQKASSPSTQSDADSIFGSEVAKQPLLPLSSIVSNKNLNMILLAHSGKQLPGVKGLNAEVETVSTTLKRLVLGRPCSLHCHKSLKNKTELLDGAILLGDGNVILAVVLFCVQTLNKSIVYELLSTRPVALNHYVDFLMSENKSSELMDLLTMLGRIPTAAMKTYQLLMTSSWNNSDAMLNKLKRIQTNHFSQPGIDGHQAKMVSDYIRLLEWQHCVGTADVRGLSVLQCLAYCCANNWNDGAGKILSPLTLCQQHQIMPIQYDWIALTVHGTLKNWEIVENLFTKKDWLGRSTVSSNIPLAKIVLHLHTLGANSNLLAIYVQQISNLEQRLDIAKQYKVHSVVIEVYAKQRDRDALTNYKMTLNAQSEEYFLAENTLRDKNIKWKN